MILNRGSKQQPHERGVKWRASRGRGIEQRVIAGVAKYLLGNVVISKKIPTYTQDHGDGIATRGESVVHVPS